jgi:hypothetical protein
MGEGLAGVQLVVAVVVVFRVCQVSLVVACDQNCRSVISLLRRRLCSIVCVDGMYGWRLLLSRAFVGQ